MLIRKSLQRINSVQAQKNLIKWIRLLKKAESAGYLNFGRTFQKVGKQLLKTKIMKINAKWAFLTRKLL